MEKLPLILLSLFSVSLCFTGALHHYKDTESVGKDERIVNGTIVPEGELPFVVALYINVSDEIKFHCGGAMISQYHVITAAHCIQGWYANRFTIRWSSNHDLASPSVDERIIQVKTVTKYPYFHFEVSTAIPTNDIAILTLEEPLPLSEVLTLPEQDAEPVAGTVCTVAGWGALLYGGDPVTSLYQVDVEVQSYDTCVESYNRQMREVMVCAGYPEGEKDACGGDSGGPLICNGVMSGIVSWGDQCAQPGMYGVYTNVALYRDWVEKHNYVKGYPEGKF